MEAKKKEGEGRKDEASGELKKSARRAFVRARCVRVWKGLKRYTLIAEINIRSAWARRPMTREISARALNCLRPSLSLSFALWVYTQQRPFARASSGALLCSLPAAVSFRLCVQRAQLKRFFFFFFFFAEQGSERGFPRSELVAGGRDVEKVGFESYM